MKTLISVAALSVATSTAFAAGTAANTSINNKASITYKVGGVTQSSINSSPGGNSDPAACTGAAQCQTTFVVDKKIDLLVTGGNTSNAVPGQTTANVTGLTFTLKNEGNSTEDFSLTPTQVATGGVDTFDTSSCAVTTPAVLPVSLTADQQITVTVKCDIPASSATVTNGASSLVDLLAEADGAAAAAAADAANPDNPSTVQTVLADGTGTTTDAADSNAKHSATSTYTISTADLSVAKTSAVLNDPINAAANPKRIPGAEIEYTITITNSGAQAATNLDISDVIPTNMTYKAGSCTVDNGGACATVGAPTVTSITATGISLAAPIPPATSTTATMTFIAIVD